MKKIILRYFNELIEFFAVITIGAAISEKLLHISKGLPEFGIMLLLYILIEIVKFLIRNTRQEKKDKKPVQTTDDISPEVLAEVRALKSCDELVKAIKLVRNTTNCSLMDAKKLVDQL